MGSRKPVKNQKSLFIAYLCWLFGGFLGLHHLYLGRDKHAFITFSTFGGYFTFGLIYDFWRLPSYVRDANNDLQYLDELHTQIRSHPKPPSSFVRQTALMIVGNLFTYLVDYAIPEELISTNLSTTLKFITIPLASASGVWLVGNVGRHRGSIRYPLIAAYLSALPTLYLNIPIGSFTTLFAMFAFNRYSKKWRLRKERKQSFVMRMTVLTLCVVLYLSLWSSWLYFNCSIEDQETNQKIKCRDAITNFLKSPAYVNLSESIFLLVERVRYQGFMGLWKEAMEAFDVTGKTEAFKTLGLSEDASPQDIVAQYRKLSREYHPDKEQDPAKKAEKHEKFIAIQQAYNVFKSYGTRYKADSM